MKRNILTLMAGALLLGMSSMSAMAAGKTIAVSWKTFQEERWKTDEAAIKAVVEAAGNKYISTDAQGSRRQKQARRHRRPDQPEGRRHSRCCF